MRKKVSILTMLCSFIMALFLGAGTVRAAGNLVPTAVDNLTMGLRSTSELTITDKGYMRVYYDGKKIGIEYYDKNFNIQSKKSLAMELSIWGGFYAGTDAYYIVQGQNNMAEDDTAEVIRVIQYDKNWKKIGTAQITSNPKIFGGDVRFPFDVGCVEMTEYNNTLYIVTGHQGYVDPMYGQGHQGYLMIAVDKTTMTGNIVDCDLWHSFAQYIEKKDDNLYVLEQSEGSMITKLTKYNAETLANSAIPVLKYGGSTTSAWSIPCYASVDDMAISSENILCLGTSIDQSKYYSVTQDTVHNIYLTVTPINNFSEEATTVKWLTDMQDAGACFLGVKITKVNDNRFLISWEEYKKNQKMSGNDLLSSSILHYVFVDGNGKKISKEFTAAAPISDCKPILDGKKIVYYASSSNMVNFYTIDAQTGAFQKKNYWVAGEAAAWSLKNGVLTISGSGEMYVDTEVHYRYPISSASHGFSYSMDDTAWKPIREEVQKVVIEQGITAISDQAFEKFYNLTEVEAKEGLKSIGKLAFLNCGSLSKVTLPSSVKSIGKDCFTIGYYGSDMYSPIVGFTIYAPESSYALKYAKQNHITYKVQDANKDNENLDTNTGNSDKKNPNKNTVKVPKKVTLSKVTSTKAKTITVKWKKVSGVTGYQLQYAKNTKFTKGKKTITIAKKTATSKKITKLKRKTKYYVRVRAYKKVKGKTYYGKWSKRKSIRLV